MAIFYCKMFLYKYKGINLQDLLGMGLNTITPKLVRLCKKGFAEKLLQKSISKPTLPENFKFTWGIGDDVFVLQNFNKQARVAKKMPFGRHKLKRYLYHFTTRENYESMLRSGCIRTSKDGCLKTLDGVFMTDLENLTKRWRNAPDWNDNLIYALFKQASKGRGEVVALRILTDGLEHSFLRVRSQNALMSSRASWRSGQIGADDHIRIGTTAKLRNAYASKKQALEYIYTENIPIEKAELVGQANLSEIWKTDQVHDSFAIKALKALFEGSPESKGLNIIT